MTFLARIESLRELETDLLRFSRSLQTLATRLSIDLAAFEADHLALRCHHLSTAKRWHHGFTVCSALLSQQIINGRPIYLFDLCQPLSLGPWEIACVELPFPGKKHYSREGWEHVELVIGGDPARLAERALALLPHPAQIPDDITLTFSNPAPEGVQGLPNPTCAVSDGQVTIKFHPYSIRDVARSEQG